MKLSNRTKNDLRTLILHSHVDLSYSGGGTYGQGDEDNTFDRVDAEKARRAIDFIRTLILNG